VSVLTTGDELVPPCAKPGPGQIREGNTLHLYNRDGSHVQSYSLSGSRASLNTMAECVDAINVDSNPFN